MIFGFISILFINELFFFKKKEREWKKKIERNVISFLNNSIMMFGEIRSIFIVLGEEFK